MPSFSPLTDSIIAIVAFTSCAAFTLRWVHHSDQARVTKTPETTRLVVVRLAVVVGILLGACGLLDIAIWIPMAALALLLLLAWGDSFLGLPGIAFLWVIQQYVLGFPAREDVFPGHSRIAARSHAQRSDLTRYIGARATTSSALKPAGEVTLGGAQHIATSENGAYLDSGETVVVTGAKNRSLLVRRIDATSE